MEKFSINYKIRSQNHKKFIDPMGIYLSDTKMFKKQKIFLTKRLGYYE